MSGIKDQAPLTRYKYGTYVKRREISPSVKRGTSSLGFSALGSTCIKRDAFPCDIPARLFVSDKYTVQGFRFKRLHQNSEKLERGPKREFAFEIIRDRSTQAVCHMIKRPIPWKALLLAPFASIPGVVIAGLGSSDAGVASDFVWGFFFAIILAVPVSYLGMVVIGLPAYLLLRHFNLLRLWIFCAIGSLVPLLFFIDAAPFRTTLMAVSSGLAVSVAGYLLRPHDSRRSSAES